MQVACAHLKRQRERGRERERGGGPERKRERDLHKGPPQADTRSCGAIFMVHKGPQRLDMRSRSAIRQGQPQLRWCTRTRGAAAPYAKANLIFDGAQGTPASGYAELQCHLYGAHGTPNMWICGAAAPYAKANLNFDGAQGHAELQCRTPRPTPHLRWCTRDPRKRICGAAVPSLWCTRDP